jgi:hypothetical protein
MHPTNDRGGFDVPPTLGDLRTQYERDVEHFRALGYYPHRAEAKAREAALADRDEEEG